MISYEIMFAVLGLLTTWAASLATCWWVLLDKIGELENKVEQLNKERADEVANVRRNLAEFMVEVAKSYVSHTVLVTTEDRLRLALDRLMDTIDRDRASREAWQAELLRERHHAR